MPTAYDAYFFDWDGTLMQSIDIWISEIQKAYKHYGIEATDQEIGGKLGDWHATLAPIPEKDREIFSRELIEAAYGRYPSAPLFDGAKALLQRLKGQGKYTALITTSERSAIETIIAQHELGDVLDLIITGDDVKSHKPDPEGIKLALKHFGVKPSRAVMVGDTDKDLGAASNAGIDSVLFYPELHAQYYDRQQLTRFNPVAVIEDWNAFCTEEAV